VPRARGHRDLVGAPGYAIHGRPQLHSNLLTVFGHDGAQSPGNQGIVAAAGEIGISVPLVVRLEGTNVDEGKAILAESGYAIISADDLGDAAQKIVAAVSEAN